MLLLLLSLGAAPSVSLSARVDGGKPHAGWVYAKVGQAVALEAKLTGAKATGWRWFKLEAATEFADNTTPSFHFEPIEYRPVELEACRDKSVCPADVTPSLLTAVEQLPGVGTMAFQVRARLEN